MKLIYVMSLIGLLLFASVYYRFGAGAPDTGFNVVTNYFPKTSAAKTLISLQSRVAVSGNDNWMLKYNKELVHSFLGNPMDTAVFAESLFFTANHKYSNIICQVNTAILQPQSIQVTTENDKWLAQMNEETIYQIFLEPLPEGELSDEVYSDGTEDRLNYKRAAFGWEGFASSVPRQRGYFSAASEIEVDNDLFTLILCIGDLEMNMSVREELRSAVKELIDVRPDRSNEA